MQPLSQQVSVEHPSRGLFFAFSISVLIHVLFALLLWNVTADRIAVEPAFAPIDTPLIVSLTTLPYSSHDNPDNKAETDTIVKAITSGAPAIKTPGDNPPATNTTSTFNLDALNRVEWSFGNIPELKAEAVDVILNQGTQGSGAPSNKSFAHYLTPSYGLDAANRFDQVFGEFSEAELQRKKIEWRVDYIKKYKASLPPDCATYYGSGGLLAIPIIIKDVITHNNKVCMW